MRAVQRSQILDRRDYERTRAAARATVMEIKRKRRIHVGPYLTFLFENTATIWYQVQEMLRAERIEREAEIRHELATYNALLGGSGQLGCCLLIEIDDPALRDRRLREWREAPFYVYVRCEGGATVRPIVDESQIDDERISAVQYLKFHVGDWRPIAVGCDLPGLIAEATLDREQRDALNDDLSASSDVAPTVGPPSQRVVVLHQDHRDNPGRRPR
jgi:hypothetical protein